MVDGRLEAVIDGLPGGPDNALVVLNKACRVLLEPLHEGVCQESAGHDRGERKDDNDIETFRTRLEEFRTKTKPVLEHYKDLGILITVNGNQSREAVFNELVEKLYEKASKPHA